MNIPKEVKADMVKYLVLLDEFRGNRMDEETFNKEREYLFNLNGGPQKFFDLVESLNIDPPVEDAANYDARLASRILKVFWLHDIEATDSNGLIATDFAGKKYPLFLSLNSENWLTKARVPQMFGLSGVPTVNSLKQAITALNTWQTFSPAKNS